MLTYCLYILSGLEFVLNLGKPVLDVTEPLEVHEICFPKLMAASIEFRQWWCHWSWHTAPLPFYWAGQWTVLGTSAGPFHCPQFNFYLGGNFLDQYSPKFGLEFLNFEMFTYIICFLLISNFLFESRQKCWEEKLQSTGFIAMLPRWNIFPTFSSFKMHLLFSASFIIHIQPSNHPKEDSFGEKLYNTR